MDKNFDITLEVMVNKEHDWHEMGSARVKITLPINHLSSLLLEKMVHELIDEAYAKWQLKALERENTERDSASADEE